MSDRLEFRAAVVASLTQVHGLSLVSALGALSDRDDLYDTGFPAEDAAAQVAREVQGERRYAPRGK